MKITVKLFAVLTDYLPPSASGHAVEMEIAENATPHEVIDLMKVPRTSAHLVLRNGVFLNSEERDRAGLKDGDALAVWPPVAGG